MHLFLFVQIGGWNGVSILSFWCTGFLARRMFVFPLLLKQSLWIPPGLGGLHSPSLDIDAIWCSHLCISEAFFFSGWFLQAQYILQFSCWKDDIIGPNPVLVSSFCYSQSGIISAGYQKDVCACVQYFPVWAALFYPSLLIQGIKPLSYHEVQHRVADHLLHYPAITLLAKWSQRNRRRSLPRLRYY